jgi:hypothetical protein
VGVFIGPHDTPACGEEFFQPWRNRNETRNAKSTSAENEMPLIQVKLIEDVFTIQQKGRND